MSVRVTVAGVIGSRSHEGVGPVLRSRRRETASQKSHWYTAPLPVSFVIVLALALVGLMYGVRHGDWVVVALNIVITAMAIWGLRLPRVPSPGTDPSPATAQPAGFPSSTDPGPSRTGMRSSVRAQPCPPATAPNNTATHARVAVPDALPAVSAFAITGRLRERAKGVTGNLSLVLPADTEVSTAPVVAVLLTVGHRILEEHGLTRQPLPQVDVTAVDRAESPPTAAPETGFTVHVTNDLTTSCSGLTIDANPLLSTPDGTLLIVATLLAGADLLLEDPDRPFHQQATPTRR